MTTSPIKSLIDEQLEDITAHNLRDAYSLAERRGFFGPPVEQYAETGYRDRVGASVGSRHIHAGGACTLQLDPVAAVLAPLHVVTDSAGYRILASITWV
ncbi:hypothetical protein QL104_11210 [Pseudomonas piscis]|uniref:Uncharacterized protein n=1 Tax=Pseudomonas piscis TaxID=2614538 RepID=A0ABY9NRQ8_9PSED|nr:hypothetical protein [Pseudomonas piscis]WMN20965.1 hypothetical protein QL104_11210 [Pseudomonas piscis]